MGLMTDWSVPEEVSLLYLEFVHHRTTFFFLDVEVMGLDTYVVYCFMNYIHEGLL